jgi:polyisoprenoid-binding protein YceI
MMNIRSGLVHVFTFKDGLLSAVAHDLRLTARGFTVQLDGDQVHATFPLQQLKIDGAMRAGTIDDRALKPKHKREIRDTMLGSKILKARKHPEAVFRGQRSGMRVHGDLLLAGRSAPIELTVTEVDGVFSGKITLVPSRWGITPYSAMFGTLKLQDRVVVTFELSADAG